MRRIVQKDPSGCGIACAAMIAGATYAAARKSAIELGIVENEPPHNTESRDLIALLGSLGVTACRGRRVSHWSSLRMLSIVGINYRASDEGWHWVVYVPNPQGGYVLDPNTRIQANRRTDFSRMKPHRYIPCGAP